MTCDWSTGLGNLSSWLHFTRRSLQWRVWLSFDLRDIMLNKLSCGIKVEFDLRMRLRWSYWSKLFNDVRSRVILTRIFFWVWLQQFTELPTIIWGRGFPPHPPSVPTGLYMRLNFEPSCPSSSWDISVRKTFLSGRAGSWTKSSGMFVK